MSDEQLASHCKCGEKNAMEQLIHKYYLPLKAFYYKLTGNPAICEDLTHNTVIKLIRNVDKYHPVFGAKFSTWLFKIAYNEYLNYNRGNLSSKETCFGDDIYDISDPADVSETVENRLLKQVLRSKLVKLPEDRRTLIILRYYNSFSYMEISSITGMPVGKVKWKLHDSLEKLKAAMKAEKGGQ